MDQRKRKKKTSPFGWIIIILVLLSNLGGSEAIGIVLGLLVIAAFIAVPVLIIFAIIRAAKGRNATPKREPSFDDCPKPLCLHRDKGEHHIRKGREMDPWDRPDIDIRKYQRRNYLREDRKK